MKHCRILHKDPNHCFDPNLPELKDSLGFQNEETCSFSPQCSHNLPSICPSTGMALHGMWWPQDDQNHCDLN